MDVTCRYTLCYSRTRDGYDTKAFHDRCANKGKKLLLVRSTRVVATLVSGRVLHFSLHEKI